MLTTLQRHLSSSFRVDLLNLTRQHEYTAGVLSFSNVARTLQDLIRLVRTAPKYDIVYLHSSFVPAVTIVRAALFLMVARLAGARTVLHVHGGSLPEWASSVPRRFLVHVGATGANAVVSVSDGISDVLSNNRTVTIYNGVDTDMFTPGPAKEGQPPVVMFAGLLTRRKGVVDLMDASRLLRERSIDHRLVVVGGRPDEGSAEEEQVRAAATGSEELVGPVGHEDMPGLLQSADIFCLPSWFEAMPLSILEAMASGLPVVATRVGQIPEVVTASIGRLVEPRDPIALADALEELLRDQPLRFELGNHARKLVLEDYSFAGTVEEIRQLLTAVAVSGELPGRHLTSEPVDRTETP